MSITHRSPRSIDALSRSANAGCSIKNARKLSTSSNCGRAKWQRCLRIEIVLFLDRLVGVAKRFLRCGATLRRNAAEDPPRTVSQPRRRFDRSCPSKVTTRRFHRFMFEGMSTAQWSRLKRAELRSRIHDFRRAFGRKRSLRPPEHVSCCQLGLGR